MPGVLRSMKINQVSPIYPNTSTTPYSRTTICSKCGMKWEYISGYWCSEYTCPVQIKTISAERIK
jgi:hypothetical protein